jgi:hypothetical protein
MAVAGIRPDYSTALQRKAIFHFRSPPALQTIELTPSGDPVRPIAVAPSEQKI